MKHLVIAASLLALFPASQTAMAQTAPAPAGVTAPAGAVSFNAVASHYAALVEASYADTLTAAKTMQQAIDAFAKSPSADSLAAARKAWLAAREFYGQTEAFRFYGGPIDDANGPEGRINAWPMDESYVDGVNSKPGSGLINKRKFAISKKALAAQNERGGEENIATGWHAIEFLLWGQDVSETGPGDRSFEDFVDGKKPNADRRRQYLTTVTELLVDDLSGVAKQWAPGVKTNYRAKFEKGGQESVRKILLGLGSLSRGELAGERLEVALNSQDQEDEHSCFSDNTHRDVVNNARGIQNVWLGEYKRADDSVLKGASLRDLVAVKDAGLAERTTKQITGSVVAAEGIQAPFDREIVGAKDAAGRLRIQKTIASLTQQSKDLAASAKAVGITRVAFDAPKK
ncbi:imelysin family protein [Polaromonas naphthalenivorans]|uniref:Putative iron-regulated protein n=1 Tax=Polaromonas naphthalenivorans (strain CJ2) TaxID=365044 RepID=A1VQD6_POLNA|nr:imelysin family protein [Polaromonas naphthalenivorans]ABM37864.1 putative iron-regulated protein [Polaromonas naphthalenivorans CJ2]